MSVSRPSPPYNYVTLTIRRTGLHFTTESNNQTSSHKTIDPPPLPPTEPPPTTTNRPTIRCAPFSNIPHPHPHRPLPPHPTVWAFVMHFVLKTNSGWRPLTHILTCKHPPTLRHQCMFTRMERALCTKTSRPFARFMCV